MADEGQTSRLAAQRAAADLEKERLVRLKGRGIEFADQRLALFAAIFGDRVDQVASQILQRAEVADLARPQPCASANSVRAISQCEKWLRSA